jgi:AraC-like DNA-binding protein
VATLVRELRSPGPSRGVLRASTPDGKMEGLRVLPPEALAPFVHHFWWLRWKLRSPFIGVALHHPAAQIVFEQTGEAHHAEVAGVRTRRYSKRRMGEGSVFGIQFRPAMFQSLLHAPMTTLTDTVVSLHRVFGSESRAWAAAIRAERELPEKMAAAEDFLLPRLTPSKPNAFAMRDLVEHLARTPSLLRVDDVVATTALDKRTLQRCFRKYVGVSPKWVIRRYRMHEAAMQLRSRHPPPLAALAAELGYADQAHFAREFKLTVGETPRAFVSNSR